MVQVGVGWEGPDFSGLLLLLFLQVLAFTFVKQAQKYLIPGECQGLGGEEGMRKFLLVGKQSLYPERSSNPWTRRARVTRSAY